MSWSNFSFIVIKFLKNLSDKDESLTRIPLFFRKYSFFQEFNQLISIQLHELFCITFPQILFSFLDYVLNIAFLIFLTEVDSEQFTVFLDHAMMNFLFCLGRVGSLSISWTTPAVFHTFSHIQRSLIDIHWKPGSWKLFWGSTSFSLQHWRNQGWIASDVWTVIFSFFPFFFLFWRVILPILLCN